MAKHKTAELSGPLLDAAVEMAVCNTGKDPRLERMGMGLMMKTWGTRPFSTDWQHGGPIIERERIAVWPFDAEDASEGWAAAAQGGYMAGGTIDTQYDQRGPTPLIAAMRAYIARMLGDVVDLP